MGVTFSALDLDIRTNGDAQALDTLAQIDARVSTIQQKIVRMVAGMGVNDAAISARAEKAAAAMADAIESAAASIQQMAEKASTSVDRIVPAAKRAAAATVEVTEAAEGMSHSALIGVGELVRGIGRVVQTGQTGAFAMREFSGAAVRLGGALGQGAGLAGIAILLAGSFYEAFSSIRKQMQATEDQFRESVARMANAAQSTKIQQQMRIVLYGQPYDDNNKLVAPSTAAPGAYTGSLADLEARFQRISAKIPAGATMAPGPVADEYNSLAKAIDAAAQKYNTLKDALLNVGNQPAEMAGVVPAMKVTAQSLEAAATKAQKEAEDAEKYLARFNLSGKLDAATLQQLGVQRTPGLVGPILPPEDMLRDDKNGIKVAKLIPTPTQKDADESIKQWQEFARKIGEKMSSTLGSAFSAGFEALFAKGGNLGKGFSALAGSLLEGLGDIFEQVGEHALAGMQLLQSIVSALTSLNPEIGIPAAIGLIALGAAMKGAGARAVSAGSGGGSAYSSSVPSAVTSTFYVNPGPASSPSGAGIAPRSSVVVQATIIGKDDPQAQRQLLEMIARAQRRGSTSG